MQDGSLYIVLIIFSGLLVFALTSLVVKKHARDRSIAQYTATLQRFEPLVDAWLLHEDTRLFRVPESETRRGRDVVEQLLLQASAGYEELWGRSLEAFKQLGYGEQHVAELGARDPRRRARSAYVLGRFECARTEGVLLGSLEDPDRDVRLAALRSLARIGSSRCLQPIVEVIKEDASIAPERAAEIFPHIGADIETIATSWLSHGSHEERVFASLLLGRATTVTAQKALERAALCDSAVDVRVKAVAGLAQVAQRKSASIIKACLSDEAWPVRAQAAKAAGVVAAVSLCPALAMAMTDLEWWVRHNAATALLRMGQRGRTTLETMLSSPDRFAAETAAEALQMSGACDEYIDTYLAAIEGRARADARDPEEILDLLGRLADTGATSRIVDRLAAEPSVGAAVRLRRLLEDRMQESRPGGQRVQR